MTVPAPAPAAPRPRAIVAGHGSFPEGMVSAVAQITGRGALLIPFTNRGLGSEEIEAGLRDRVRAHDVTVIFTDLPGGSATLAARRIQHAMPSLMLVTGTNLAMLVDFVFRDEEEPPSTAASEAAERGRGAITVTGSS